VIITNCFALVEVSYDLCHALLTLIRFRLILSIMQALHKECFRYVDWFKQGGSDQFVALAYQREILRGVGFNSI